MVGNWSAANAEVVLSPHLRAEYKRKYGACIWQQDYIVPTWWATQLVANATAGMYPAWQRRMR